MILNHFILYKEKLNMSEETSKHSIRLRYQSRPALSLSSLGSEFNSLTPSIHGQLCTFTVKYCNAMFSEARRLTRARIRQLSLAEKFSELERVAQLPQANINLEAPNLYNWVSFPYSSSPHTWTYALKCQRGRVGWTDEVLRKFRRKFWDDWKRTFVQVCH